MDKTILVIGGKPIEFDNIELAQAYIKENNLANVELLCLEPLPEPFPCKTLDECFHNFKMVELPTFIAPSGQENRRERRAKERANKKKL